MDAPSPTIIFRKVLAGGFLLQALYRADNIVFLVIQALRSISGYYPVHRSQCMLFRWASFRQFNVKYHVGEEFFLLYINMKVAGLRRVASQGSSILLAAELIKLSNELLAYCMRALDAVRRQFTDPIALLMLTQFFLY